MNLESGENIASNRNHRYQAMSKAIIQDRTRSSPRFRGTTSSTHPSTSAVTPPPVVGDKVSTTGAFASRLRLKDGTPKTLMGILDESEGGIVVWTFKPRAEDEGSSSHLSHINFPTFTPIPVINQHTNLINKPATSPPRFSVHATTPPEQT